MDYLGIASDLKEALSFYSEAGGKGDPALVQDEAATILQEKLEVLDGIMHGFNYQEYFTADTSRKLNIILEAEEHILGVDQGEGKTRFLTDSNSDVTGICISCTTSTCDGSCTSGCILSSSQSTTGKV